MTAENNPQDTESKPDQQNQGEVPKKLTPPSSDLPEPKILSTVLYRKIIAEMEEATKSKEVKESEAGGKQQKDEGKEND